MSSVALVSLLQFTLLSTTSSALSFAWRNPEINEKHTKKKNRFMRLR